MVAALVFRIDPYNDYTRLTRLGRVSATGETYAFNKTGKLLTESRFESDLRAMGLLHPNQRSLLNIEIRDPGGNRVEGFISPVPRDKQPLTRMAADAVRGNSGLDLDGYR